MSICLPASAAVTATGVAMCALCGLFAGVVPTYTEAGQVMRRALDVSYGRWALQCLGTEDLANVPNALAAVFGDLMIEASGWPSTEDLAARGRAGPCEVPTYVLVVTGLGLRLVGAFLLVACHRGRQNRGPLFKMPRWSAGRTVAPRPSAVVTPGPGGGGSDGPKPVAGPSTAPSPATGADSVSAFNDALSSPWDRASPPARPPESQRATRSDWLGRWQAGDFSSPPHASGKGANGHAGRGFSALV